MKTIYLKIIALFLSFFDVQISSCSRCMVMFRRPAKTFFNFFFLNWFYLCFSPLFSGVFLNVIRYSKKWKFCCIQFHFVLWSKIITCFCLFNFLAACHAAKKKHNFLFSYKLHASSWVFFVDISLIFGRSFLEH